MQYTAIYSSPLGQILLAADHIGLTGLWFEGQKYFPQHLPDPQQAAESPFLLQAKTGWINTFPAKSLMQFRRCI